MSLPSVKQHQRIRLWPGGQVPLADRPIFFATPEERRRICRARKSMAGLTQLQVAVLATDCFEEAELTEPARFSQSGRHGDCDPASSLEKFKAPATTRKVTPLM
jgi:hypothetical protein